MSLENILPKASRAMVWVARLLLAGAIASIWVPYSIIIKPAALLAILGTFSLLIIGVACVRKGYKPARTYLTAWSALIFGIVVFGLKTFGILPSNAFTEFAVQVGSALEVTLLSLALADRIHAIQAQEVAAQASLFDKDVVIAQETQKHFETTKQLNQALHSKLFLFSDLAHRVNNPLNIAQGGNESSRAGLQEFSQTVFSLLPEPKERSTEEDAVVQHLEDSVLKINNSLADTHAGLHRAAAYVSDLRIISGVDGESPEPNCLEEVLLKAMERLHEDLGETTKAHVQLPANLLDLKVAGHPSVLAAGLTNWMKHALIRKPDENPVLLNVNTEASGDYVWLKATTLNQAAFSKGYHEDIPAKDIVLGLLGQQGAEWRENTNDQGHTNELLLRLAATEGAWFDAQGGRERK